MLRFFKLLLFLSFFFYLSRSMAVTNGSTDDQSYLLYRLWEKEARTFGFADSSEIPARKAVDDCLERMFREYIRKKGDARSLQRDYPIIGQLTDHWEVALQNKMTFRQFRKVISTELSSRYHAVENKTMKPNNLVLFEKEMVLWTGDLIKTTSYYSERVYAYYHKKGENRPQKLEDSESSLHTLFAGRGGNSDRRRYNCESFSKAMVLLAGQLGVDPTVVSVITVIKDRNGKPVSRIIVENGLSKEVGHVCNLISLSDGKRFYYDQGTEMKPGNEHQTVLAYDQKGKQYELTASTDSLWCLKPSLLGQTISDMKEIYHLDNNLNEIEEFIAENVKKTYTNPNQTNEMKTIYKDLLDDINKLSYHHIRVIATDIVKEKVKAVKYELQFQIDQLDQATKKLQIQKNENLKVAEFNNAIERYNRHNDRYRQLITQNRNDVPTLKTSLKSLKKECVAQRESYRQQKGFVTKSVKSADGRILHFSMILEQYNNLIKSIDQVLELPAEVKQLNIK